MTEHYTSIRSACLEEPLGKLKDTHSVRCPGIVGAGGEPYQARGLFAFTENGKRFFMHSDANATFNMFRKYIQIAKNKKKRPLHPEFDYFAPLRQHRNWMLRTPKTINLDKQKSLRGKSKKHRRMGNLSPSSVVRRS